MLTETPGLSRLGGSVVYAESQPHVGLQQPVHGGSFGRLLPFAAIVLQFGLIVLLIDYWQLENITLSRIMQLAFAGFIIHHFLPLRLRLPFFAGLSLVAVVTGVGHLGPSVIIGLLNGRTTSANLLYHAIPGLTLIGIGLALIGICHLPFRYRWRIVALGIVAVVLTVLRVKDKWFPDLAEMWAILGSMFMFRLIVYLYDLRNQTVPFSPARAISYFFMLPNVCFPLFPLVDYKTFCTTWYNDDWLRLNQSGLKWMVRGVFQLLLYRVVYQFAPLDVSQLSSGLDVAGFVVGTYLLYLRISGTFHLIVGLLHMFGFNLPETHHLYLLASSFTDFWRRINIYWKDFVMKIFFYPVHFKLRRIGMLRAMSLATLATFVATWVLHSWQWYWIRGSVLVTWQDVVFWGCLGILVLVNGLYEATAGRRRTLSTSRMTLGKRAIGGLQTIVTFIVICSLWTVWSCQSTDELKSLVDAASHPTSTDIAIILMGLLVLGVCSMIWGRSNRETSEGRNISTDRPAFKFWHSASTVTAGSLCLLALPSVASWLNPSVETVVARLHGDTLNTRDIKLQRRGYYEDLDVGRSDSWRLHQAKMAQLGRAEEVARDGSEAERAREWDKGKKLFYRDRSDFLLKEIVPSVSAFLGGTYANANQFGMRDREYDRLKRPNTYRMVLLGSSHEQGTGVKDDETYENQVEDALNRNRPDPGVGQYEILNLSVGGYSILQKLLRLEQDGFQYQPDAAILCTAAADQQFLVDHVRKTLLLGIVPPEGYRDLIESIVRKAGLSAQMPAAVVERRLARYIEEINQWAFRRFADECAKRGVRPLVVYRPAPIDFEGLEQGGRSQMIHLTQAAGLTLIDLSSAFASVGDRTKLTVAEWDHHTNKLGHHLLADQMYKGLIPVLRAKSPAASLPGIRTGLNNTP